MRIGKAILRILRLIILLKINPSGIKRGDLEK